MVVKQWVLEKYLLVEVSTLDAVTILSTNIRKDVCHSMAGQDCIPSCNIRDSIESKEAPI